MPARISSKTFKVDEFEVSYDGQSVVTLWGAARDEQHFDQLLDKAHTHLTHFRQTKPGSVWGCDGVGYVVQKRLLRVQVCKSGVQHTHFIEGLMALQAGQKAA